jgi:hypothetical protein
VEGAQDRVDALLGAGLGLGGEGGGVQALGGWVRVRMRVVGEWGEMQGGREAGTGEGRAEKHEGGLREAVRSYETVLRYHITVHCHMVSYSTVA